MKKSVLKFILTLTVMALPSVMLFYRGGYAYSIPFIFLVVFFMYFNNFKYPHRSRYKKIITAVPVVILFYWLANPGISKTTELAIPSLPDMKIAVILSCISVFTAVVSALLILKRTKGEKAHE